MRVCVVRTAGGTSLGSNAGSIQPGFNVTAVPDAAPGRFCVALIGFIPPFEKRGQSSARPLCTSHSPRSASPTEQVATVRPYWSRFIGVQLTGRLAMKASRSFAAFAPQRYCKLSSPRHSWVLSGASIHQRRIRVPCISIVSPSMTLACPIRSSARAGLQSDRHINKAAVRRVIIIWIASANPVRLVQEIFAIAERRLGVLIDRDDDCLYVRVAVALRCRLPSYLGQRLDPRWDGQTCRRTILEVRGPKHQPPCDR